MRPPSPWPSEAGPTDSPTQTRGVGRTPGASARPGHGSAGGQVGEDRSKKEMRAVRYRCTAGLGPVFSYGGTLPATGLPAICHLALLMWLLLPWRTGGGQLTAQDQRRPHRAPSTSGWRAADPGGTGVRRTRRAPRPDSIPALDAVTTRDGQLPVALSNSGGRGRNTAPTVSRSGSEIPWLRATSLHLDTARATSRTTSRARGSESP